MFIDGFKRLVSQLLMLSTTSVSFSSFHALSPLYEFSLPLSSSSASLSPVYSLHLLSLSVALGYLAVLVAMLDKSLVLRVLVLPVSLVESVCVNCRQPECRVRTVCRR